MTRQFPDLTSPEENIYDAIVGRAETDPDLNGIFATVYKLAGDQPWPDDRVPDRQHMPAIVFEVPGIPSEPMSNVEHGFTMQLNLIVFVQGQNIRDIFAVQELLWQSYMSKSFDHSLSNVALPHARVEQFINGGGNVMFLTSDDAMRGEQTMTIQYNKKRRLDEGG